MKYTLILMANMLCDTVERTITAQLNRTCAQPFYFDTDSQCPHEADPGDEALSLGEEGWEWVTLSGGEPTIGIKTGCPLPDPLQHLEAENDDDPDPGFQSAGYVAVSLSVAMLALLIITLGVTLARGGQKTASSF